MNEAMSVLLLIPILFLISGLVFALVEEIANRIKIKIKSLSMSTTVNPLSSV